jgi:selenide, water dikinase
VLTKPLGIGILTTAIKRGLASAETIQRAVDVMATLNKVASEAMIASGAVHAATDVTGFGLLGHLSEMLGAGGIGVRLEADAVPVLEEAWDFVRQDVVPGGTRRNLASVESFVDWSERLSPEQRLVLADAQTSGGLLMAIDPASAATLLTNLHEQGITAATQVGTFTDNPGRIEVV